MTCDDIRSSKKNDLCPVTAMKCGIMAQAVEAGGAIGAAR